MTDFTREESWVQNTDDLSASKTIYQPAPLKPCPFCGKAAKWGIALDVHDIMCGTMGCYLAEGAGWVIDEEGMLEHEVRWNTRPGR